ncbi:hypothetical protein [Pelagovum pacificum]|uniref:Oxidoreductase n=1 Tax=Pelagovum pacificum TaxID=2588711 RepID=A0A5C5GJ49_9RHOB|nr:hypothetical protein [Pelagovum pacificum]QQA42948.1 hypothetical protein I8N54_19605 [Pelagovum pacificum]TNY33909.1 hypothetical protein FHY64_11785 [Pelagovum pacificum]
MADEDFRTPSTPAEEALLAAVTENGRALLSEALPDEAVPKVTVRAGYIRHLLMAEDSPLRGRGLRLRGAWISGMIDLHGVDCPRDITLRDCVLDEPLDLVNASLRGLHLTNVRLRGLAADNAKFSGSVYLRDGTASDREISLAGARIGGDLQLCGAEFRSESQDAVFAPSLQVEGSIYLGNYPFSEGVTTLVAQGTLFFASAIAGHDIFVTNTSVSVNEGIVGSVFGATEEHGPGIAISLGRARIGGILYFDDNQIGQGIVNLAGATCARFKDEPTGPGANYPIRLDGFRYGDFSRHAETDVQQRLDWLKRRPEETPFTAQPYEHLANVLRGLGHRDDANRVLIEKERLMRRADLELIRRERGHSLEWGLTGFWNGFLRMTVGYGYHPARAVVIALLLIAGLGLFFEKTWDAGDMAPNLAPILVSANWVAATESHPENPAAYWSQPGQAGQDYETFNGLAYAADLVLPVINLGQENAWAPSTSRSDWGRAGWWIRWFAKGIGWVVAALVAAAITGVIRKE